MATKKQRFSVSLSKKAALILEKNSGHFKCSKSEIVDAALRYVEQNSKKSAQLTEKERHELADKVPQKVKVDPQKQEAIQRLNEIRNHLARLGGNINQAQRTVNIFARKGQLGKKELEEYHFLFSNDWMAVEDALKAVDDLRKKLVGDKENVNY